MNTKPDRSDVPHTRNDGEFLRPAPKPALQARSLKAMRKVVEAFDRLLDETPYDRISMSEIAREAGVSVGTIYTRFPSKEHLLFYLVEETAYAQILDALDQAAILSEDDNGTLAGVIYSFFSTTADIYRSTRKVFAPFSLVLRMSDDATLLEPVARYNDDIHSRLMNTLLKYRGTIAHSNPEDAVKRVILWGLASLREQSLYGEPVSHLSQEQDDQTVDELCNALTLYLTSKPVMPETRPQEGTDP